MGQLYSYVLIEVRRVLIFCLIEKPKYNNNKVLSKMENVNFCVCLISSDTNVSAYKS
jgi:hypothetical protein